MKYAALGTCCLMLSACLLSSNEARVTADHAATIKRVGLLSLLDPRLSVSYLSTSAQDSTFALAALDNWDPDRLVQERIGARLRHKGFEVVPLQRTPELVEAQGSGWTYPQSAAVNATLFETAASAALDMVVVVYPQVSEDFVTSTNQKIRGYGFQKAFDSEAFAYATVYLEAVDVKRRFVAGKSEGRQFAPLDASLWHDDYARKEKELAIPPGERATISDAVGTLLANALGIAAQEAGF